jgi:Cof subfamily protein (haloacid dehalogenase superfamily)
VTGKFQLAAFDLDGTLVGRDNVVTARVLEAVTKMHDAGIRGCLCTGRMYRACIAYARELHFEAPVICYQGAAIIDPSTDEILSHLSVPNDVVRDLISWTQADRMYLQLYRNDEYYSEARNRFSDLYASVAQVQPVVVPSLREAFAFSEATKAVVIADAPEAAAYEKKLAERLGTRAYVTRSLPEFVEVLNPAVDKGAALRFVSERLGIPRDAVAAIGDSWNDAPLLEAAGFGIAMGSAPAELREVADAVVADVTNDGVAEAIERYILA